MHKLLRRYMLELTQILQTGLYDALGVENGRLQTITQTYQLPPLPDFAAGIIKDGEITRYVKENGRFLGE